MYMGVFFSFEKGYIFALKTKKTIVTIFSQSYYSLTNLQNDKSDATSQIRIHSLKLVHSNLLKLHM